MCPISSWGFFSVTAIKLHKSQTWDVHYYLLSCPLIPQPELKISANPVELPWASCLLLSPFLTGQLFGWPWTSKFVIFVIYNIIDWSVNAQTQPCFKSFLLLFYWLVNCVSWSSWCCSSMLSSNHIRPPQQTCIYAEMKSNIAELCLVIVWLLKAISCIYLGASKLKGLNKSVYSTFRLICLFQNKQN